MAVKPIGTTALTWGSLLGRGNREPIDATQLNYSYTDLLWELNQRTVSYQIGANNGGSGNYYVGLITAVPYVNEDDKRKDSHYTVDANGNKKLETIDMKGPWYVSYKGTDKGRGTAKNKYGFVPDGNPNTYYADRIVLKQEMDYTLDNGFVRKTQLGTYYTGVGHWYDSYTKSKTYANGLECPDGVYFPTTSYAEIFNDYTHNVATGIFSHAEGGGTTASGNYSHAEGDRTMSAGTSTHAEGTNTSAYSIASHAEGGGTTASGNYSHAEGGGTTASGEDSHAEGGGTTASGPYSHAEGNSTYANGDYSHAEGSRTMSAGTSTHAEGTYTSAYSIASHAEGYGTNASGDQSHAEGNTTKATGANSHAEGNGTYANGENSHAEGGGTLAYSIGSHAEGGGTTASGPYSHAEGGGTIASGHYSHAEGGGTTASGNQSHTEGYTTKATGANSHAEGNSTKATGDQSHAEGGGTTASGNQSHAEGNATKATGANSHAEGIFTYVHSTAENSHAEGTGSYTKGVNAHAENSSYANGKNSHSGGEATAGGVNSFAHGVKRTLASGANSIALVSGTASGSNSIAFTGTASGNSSISLDGTASGSNSVSIQGTAKSTDSIAIGQGAIAETGQGAMALIKGHATGQQSLATNASSASGTNSVAMNASSASNTQSFAVNNSTASGINSASTNKGNASGENSISTNISTATGVNSAALNNGNASGEGSVAMNYSKATGKGSVAIGLGTIASGEYSLSNGHETRANNHDSHAEGYGTNASGDQSHAEGIVTTTNGLASHAEGQGSTTGTNATAAHAEGSYTIANNESEHAQGKYNVSDTENSGTLFTIGNGTANDKRHNVVGIYHNGDINIEGPNTTNHNTGYFKTTVDGNHTEVVRGNYTQTIGTTGKNNTCNITVNGNTTNRLNGTSDTRITGATYEGYGSTFISSVTGFKSSYAYNNVFNKVNKSSYNYIGEYLGTYVSKSISERSDTNVYLSAPKICIHGDTATDGTYVDISSDVSYVYGRRHTYIGQPVHGGTSVTTTIKGNTINENSTTSNKTTNTNNETVTGNSTTNVTGSTNLTTGSLNITSGSTNLDLNKTHIHTTNELCIKSNTNTYFKGATNTYLGKDQEGYKGTNFYVSSSNTGDLTSPNISLNASTKYDENVGNKSLTATGTLNEDITGVVTTTNRNNCNIYTYGNSYTYVHGNITDTAEGERLVVTKGSINIHNLNNSNTYTSGNTYQYTSGNKTDTVSGTITINCNTINENSTTSNKTTNTNNETVTGNSTTNVTGSTNLTTGSLNITSGVTNLNLNKTHIHVTNDLCIKSSTNTYFKGATNTYVGKDQEGNKGTNFYVTSSTLGDLTSPSISLNASKKYDENIGNKSVIAKGTLTEDITGIVTTTNRNNCNIYTYGNSYTYIHGNITDTAEGERLVVTKSNVNVHNLSNSTTSTSGNTYQYTSSNKTDAVGGTRTNITNGNVSTTNKANVSITTRGAHTESITNERSFTVGKHDSLIVNSGGRTEKITGEKITQVVSGNINAYTDDTHDTRLHTRSTYVETVHTYIGDKTNTYISGNYSVGLGQGIKISSYTNVSTGKYNKDEASYFAVGIGTSDTNRKNAFWISQGTTAGTNGVAYFSNNTYVYGNTYDPGQYPNNKEDKSWSAVVTYNMYRNSYTYLYKTVNDKFNTFGTGTYFTKSIDPFTYTPVSYTLHYTTQTFNNKENSWPIVKHQYVLPQAIPGALENDNSGMAGLMSARDKARLDSIWEGDKQIAGIQISTGSWQVFKNDGSTYTLANIKHQSNSITNIKVEYGFKVKWSGTWKWTVNNQKNAEECKGAWGTTLPAVNTNSSTYTSPVLSGNESGNWSQICYETIYAAKRGLIISGYPDDYAASSNGSRHLGSIVPASGKDNRSCSVSWATYRLLFYGMCTQAEADGLNIGVMKTKTTKDITKRSWEIYYNSDSSHCFFMAYPAAFGNIATIKKNGVEIITSSFLKVGAVNYTNGAGYTQQYYVYRSGVGAAGMSITIS